MPFAPVLAVLLGPVLSLAASLAVIVPPSARAAEDMESAVRVAPHVRFLPAAGDAQGLVVLLPGSSGLEIFGDQRHYHRVAERWNARCYDALIVDYKPIWRENGRPDVGETGHRIAWALNRATAWLEAQGLRRGDRSILAAWSLGGEGVWALADTPNAAQDWDAAVLYYPSNQDDLAMTPPMPTLALTGTEDDVVNPAALGRAGAASDHLTVRILPGAHHGFDISSLTRRRVVRLLPFIGPRATFEHNPSAARIAEAYEADFFDRLGLGGCIGSG